MKTLTLLRHAKSGWDDPTLRDFDRPLNAKGRRAAGVIGRHLRDEGLGFDRIVASPAVRVMETLDAVAAGFGPQAGAGMGPAALPGLGRRARRGGARAGRRPRSRPDRRPQPGTGGSGAAAHARRARPAARRGRGEISYGERHGDDPRRRLGGAGAGGATLTRFVRPRDLDPTLGPDED